MLRPPFKSLSILVLLIGTVLLGVFFGGRPDKEYPKEIVTIPEGYTIAQIDAFLSSKKIIQPGGLTSLSPDEFDYPFLAGVKTGNLEGFLFPDTYEFFLNSPGKVAARKFLDNFGNKTADVFGDKDIYATVIMASMIEKEVPAQRNDRAMIAGILRNRLEADMPLGVDAAVCYAESPLGCGAVDTIDFNIDSAYNTYHNKGLPPGPISNPGLSAIKAAVNPEESPNLYYLSRPDTGETIFSKTLDEHNKNIVKYLK